MTLKSIGRRVASKIHRTAIHPIQLRYKLRTAKEIKLIIGAERIAYKGWIATEAKEVNLLKPKSWRRYLGERKVSRILAEHVWEHLSPEDGELAAKVSHEFLVPGGQIRVAVPDGFFPDPEYIAAVRPGGHGAGSDDHKVLFTYKTLQKVFESAGFEVLLLEYFDESGCFHSQELDLEDGYISRSHKNKELNPHGRIEYSSIIIDAVKVR